MTIYDPVRQQLEAENTRLTETLRLRSAALSRVSVENERLRTTVGSVKALTDGPYSEGYRSYAVSIGGEVHLAVLLDDLRTALGESDG